MIMGIMGEAVSIPASILLYLNVPHILVPSPEIKIHLTLLSEMVPALQWADNQLEIQAIILSGEGKLFYTGIELLDFDWDTAISFAISSDFHTLNRILIGS
jgi:enoyl-CoA hydratase/carnithine racemase